MSRVVLVTGAAGGIGAATVHRLAAEGHHVLAVDNRGCALERLAGCARVVTRVADVRDRTALADCVEDARDRWGRLDAVVAAAAVVAGGVPLWDTPDADLQLLWDVDVRGVWNTAAVAVPAMLANPEPAGCRFVAIASAAGSHGLYRLAAYNAAKHAVVGLVKGLAADLVGTGVTACAVSPGSTRTPMLRATAALYGMPDVDAFAGNQLLHRILEPAEVAATIAHCAGPDGALLNGSVVHADGGFAP
ncbi:mycofactocin-coupled SDR family oxidoreductase [Nocardioides ultimimeridianus]